MSSCNIKFDIRQDFYQMLDRYCQLISHRDFCNEISKLASEERSKGFLAELKELQEDHGPVDLERGSSD